MSNANTWNPIEELCGFILTDGTIIEVANRSPRPKETFLISQEDIAVYGLDKIQTFWHSHPSNNTNLSAEDYFMFLQYPDHKHRIYSQDGYADYIIRNGLVIKDWL